jgi:hypothetical protein
MTPYISIVITGRNDNYGVNFLGRLNTFIKSLSYQVKEFPNLIELIIVEWNPPHDTLPLKDVIHLPDNLNVRIITVSNDIHNKLESKTPMLEFYAKNVGIRRAHGEFVLVTNPDIIFTNEMILFFAKRELNKDWVYRTDRYDYLGDGIENINVSDYVDFALSKTFLANLCVGYGSETVKVDLTGNNPALPISNIVPASLHLNGCGDYILASKQNFFKIKGLWETQIQKWHLDSYSLLKFYGHKFNVNVLLAPFCIFHMDHPRKEPDVKYDPFFASQILQNPNVLTSNTQNYWGLDGINLPEFYN